jgi:hypothetical protein
VHGHPAVRQGECTVAAITRLADLKDKIITVGAVRRERRCAVALL